MRTLCFLFFVSMLCSCKNELELYGDNYIETPVIYGVVDLINDTQIIRVNKTFRNTTSAAETFKIYDSLCFENIQVTLTCLPSGHTLILNPIARPGKQSSKRDLYSIPSSTLDAAFDSLRLTVTNLNTGNTFSSISGNVPAPTYLFPSNSILNDGDNAIPFSSPGGALFNAVIRLHYTEYPPGIPEDSVQLYVDYITLPIDLHNPHMPVEKNFKFKGSEVVRVAQAVIGTSSNTRIFREFSTFISTESNDMANFLFLGIPSIHIIQKNPFYSNVPGAIGLFTMRGTARLTHIQPNPGMRVLMKAKLNMD
jgi:hypothetical protein